MFEKGCIAKMPGYQDKKGTRELSVFLRKPENVGGVVVCNRVNRLTINEHNETILLQE